MQYDNISYTKVISRNGSFYIVVPDVPLPNTAYFVPTANAYDGLASIPVADDIFETDNADFRAQIGKIQYAPRLVVITGRITTPVIDSEEGGEESAFEARVAYLRQLHKILAPVQEGLNLEVVLADGKTYKLYCHLHGGEGLRIQKFPEYYEVVLTLEAEDPLLYEAATKQTTTVENTGDVPEFARIELLNCVNVTSYSCTDSAGIPTTVQFRQPVTGKVIIDVAYPGQICSITSDSATHIGNIDVSGGKPAFIRVPVGESTWIRTGDSGTVSVYPRSPVIGVSP